MRRVALLLLCVTLPLSGTASSSAQDAVDAQRDVTVHTHGLTPAQVTALRRALVSSRADLPGGAVAGLWVPGRGSWIGAIGSSDLARNTRMRPALQMPVGSVTKTLTGTIVLQEVQRGRLRLADRMARWFPHFPEAGRITILMLLNMTTGIADFVNGRFAQVTAEQRRHPKRIWRPREIIAGAAKMPREFRVPGSRFAYSNTNTVILGRILERVTGKSYPKLLRRRLFDPVGMRRSLLGVSGQLSPPFAHNYSTLYGEIHGSPKLLDVTGYSLSLEWAAGGVASTLRDMRAWARALGTGSGVLRPAMQRRRTRHCALMASNGVLAQQYCLGVAVVREVGTGRVVSIFHNGTVLGASSYVAYYPSTRAVLVVQANQDAQTGPHGWTIPDAMAAAAAQAVPNLLGM